MSGVAIIVENVSRSFTVGDGQIWAVRDLSLTVAPGEFIAVIGRSGSGKTTLLNLIAGLERPSSGSIRMDGEEITRLSEKQLTELRRRRIGFVFQSFGLLPLLSAQENVELALRIAGAGRRERIARAHEVLGMMGLARRAHHRPYELSGGEQQRVAIARAIANRPALILADEPTGELDSVTGQQIFRVLRDIARAEGITIMTSTHDRTVMELAGRVEELGDGRLLAPGQRDLLRYVTAREPEKGEIPAASRAATATPAASDPVLQTSIATAVMPATEAAPSSEAERWAAPPTRLPEVPDAAPVSRTEAALPEVEPDITRWAPPEHRP